MTEYVGIDFGNAMVKAAVVESPDGMPRTLRLSERDPFLPLALRQGKSGYRAGWSAYSHRRRDTVHTVASMRNQWSSATLTASLAGRPQPVTALLGEFLAATGRRGFSGRPAIRRESSLPFQTRGTTRIGRCRWPPAALAGLPKPTSASGRPPCRLPVRSGSEAVLFEPRVLCRPRDVVSAGRWRVEPGQVGGRAVGCGRGIAEANRRQRGGGGDSTVPPGPPRAPRERSRPVRRDRSRLYQLHRQPETAVSVTLSGESYSVPYSRAMLAALADDYRPSLKQLVVRLWDNEGPVRPCPIVAWGELSGLLPVDEWLSEQGPVRIQSLDSLAAGSARLCAAMLSGRITANSTPTAAVCPQCGEYSALKRQGDCPNCRKPLVTLWETLRPRTGGAGGRASPC